MGEIDTRSDPRIGTRLGGRYRLEERIASGGMATVYKARDESLGRDVAVKVMHPALAADRSFVDRFRAEASNAARLSHPNIVTVYDTAESNATGGGAVGERVLFIVMELCEGMTLRALLERFGYLDPPTVRHVAHGIADALDHAHEKGIVHRDVKPENVILTPDGQVKVVDFGIAKALGPQATQLTTDRPIGTVAYVAPEQINGGSVDGRADVYALGAMTYEMLTGSPPFRGDTPQAVAAARLHSPVLSPGISPSLDGAVMRATSARPEDRFETPGAFARALGDSATPAFLMTTDQLPDVATVAVPAMPLLEPPVTRDADVTDVLPLQTRLYFRSRRRFRTGVIVAAFLAIAAIAAYVILPHGTTVPEVRGQTLVSAKHALKKEGLKVGVVSEVFSDEVDKDAVVRTDPPIHTSIKKGTIVDVFMSKGPELFLVPPVVGKSLDEAKSLMSGVGFTLQTGSHDFSDTVPKGKISEISPDIARAKRGTAFTATVSDGPPLVNVPEVASMTGSKARAALEGAGLVYSEVGRYSDTVDEGIVISSDPAGGGSAPKGSSVSVFVSKGPQPFPMPNFVGMSLKAAKAKATASGLVVRNAYAVPGSGKPSRQVQGQNPPAGTTVRKGAAIDLYYAT